MSQTYWKGEKEKQKNRYRYREAVAEIIIVFVASLYSHVHSLENTEDIAYTNQAQFTPKREEGHRELRPFVTG